MPCSYDILMILLIKKGFSVKLHYIYTYIYIYIYIFNAYRMVEEKMVQNDSFPFICKV